MEGGGERQKAQGGEGRREEEFLLVSLSLSVSLEDELEATWGQRERKGVANSFSNEKKLENKKLECEKKTENLPVVIVLLFGTDGKQRRREISFREAFTSFLVGEPLSPRH